MEKYKMLRKHSVGYPHHFTDALAAVDGMIVVEMTSQEISDAVGGRQPLTHERDSPKEPEEGLKTTTDDKPGPGWIKNTRGTWSKKPIKEHTETDKSTEEVVPPTEV